MGKVVWVGFNCFSSSMDNLCPDSEFMFHDLLGVLLLVEPVVPTPHAARRGVGNVLPSRCPSHLITLALHQGDKLFPGCGAPHALVDGVHEPELPALSLGGGAVFTGTYPLLPDPPLGRRQDLQPVGGADLVAGQPVGLEVGGALVEFAAVLEADTVHHQVVVQVDGIHVGSHYYLEVRELPLGQLQAYSVELLGCQSVLLPEGLDEVVVLPSVRFSIPFLGEPHLGIDALCGAVPTRYQLLSLPQGLFLLLDVPQHPTQSAAAAAPVLDGGESSYLRSPPVTAAGAVH